MLYDNKNNAVILSCVLFLQRFKTLLCAKTLVILLGFASHTHAETTLNGLATHTEFGKPQFIGALYLDQSTTSTSEILNSQQDKKIVVKVVAEKISARRFRRMWIEGMAINSARSDLTAQAQNMAKFSNLLKISLLKDDIFQVTRNADNVSIELNNQPLGEIDNPAFFDLLIRTWLGSVPLSSGFRDGLASAGDVDEADKNQFDQISPSAAREEATLAALEAIAERKNNTTRTATRSIAQATPAPVVATTAELDIQAPTLSLATPEPAPSPTPTPETEVASVNDDSFEESEPLVPISNSPEEEELDEFEEISADALLEEQLYIITLKRWTQKFIKYPRVALNRGHQGNLRLEVTLNRDGSLRFFETLEKSKYNSLNKAAIKAINKAEKYPPIPPGIKGETFTFTMPVVFTIKEV